MITSQTVTAFLEQQFPDYVLEYYPMFVIFVTKYYEWLEQGGNPQYIIQNIRYSGDIDNVASSLVTRFMAMYAPNLPVQASADRSIVLKYIRQFYQKKGSEESFKFFFRAFFNDEVTVFYPRTILFKPSDNNWYTEQKLTITKLAGSPDSSIHTVVIGSSSGARAVVNASRRIEGTNRWELVLQPSSVTGVFTSGETIATVATNWTTRSSSLVTMALTQPLQSSAGVFLNTRSMLSADQVIQDSYYFQQFSYVIRTRIGRENWAQSVLQQLHPAGLILFSDLLLDSTIAGNNTSSFLRTVNVETTVRIPTRQDFYIAPGYTFDRLADFRTGTSATTSAGAIAYDANYNYPGEKVTFALQKEGDEAIYGTVRQTIIPTGPSWDKIRPGVGNREQIVTQGLGIDFTAIRDLYRNTSAMTLTAGTVIAGFTTSISDLTGVLTLITWVKDPTGNASNELANVLSIDVTATAFASSTASLTAAGPLNISEEVQRNFRAVAVGSSQLYPELIYYSSSNMITAVTSITVQVDSSVVTTARYLFRPFNANRSQSFSRFSILSQGSPEVTGETITFSIAVSSDSQFATTSSDFLSIVTIGK
jgi:hypothetical protein